jgi:Domain of Unknown Function (DUF1080)
MTMKSRSALTLASFALLVAACSQRAVSVGSPAAGPTALNTLTPLERTDGWRLLFDGNSLSTFRDYHADTLSHAWSIVDGVIVKTRSTEDIVTRESFANFELSWDWMLPPGGNSGVFIRATEEYDKIYWSGPEFQLLDDSLAPDGTSALTSAGAAYGLYAPPRGVARNGGHWNSSRIVANGSHVEHWMNGQKIVEYEAWSPDWKAKVAASKFNAYPNFGLARSGLIGFQGDHAGSVELRNIKIRVLR